MELIVIFFVNAIAYKKRFSSPIFQRQPEGFLAIAAILSFGIPRPQLELCDLRCSSLWLINQILTTAAPAFLNE